MLRLAARSAWSTQTGAAPAPASVSDVLTFVARCGTLYLFCNTHQKAMSASLRLPDDVKRRVAKLAAEQDTTAHAFMLSAIREKVEADELRLAFYAEAERRLARMKRTGKGIPKHEVDEYFRARARGETPARPKARKLA
jgi:predicted transcriptional regulator